MAIPATTTLRTCRTCGLEAKTRKELLLFVKDSSRPEFYFTKALCKKCNNEKAKVYREGGVYGPHYVARCRGCGIIPVSHQEHQKLFVKDKSVKGGWSKSLCKGCNSRKAKQHAKNFPELFKMRTERYRIRKHGIEPDAYFEMFQKQLGACKVCKQVSNKLYIDHDHSCCDEVNSCGKCVRGLLCNRCNLLLGLAKDQSDILNSAINYLEGNS